MIQENMEMDRHTSGAIIELADELIKKLETNDQVINERRVSSTATDRLSSEIINFLRHAVAESQDIGEVPDVRLSKLVEAVSSLVGSLETSIRSSSDEMIRLEATQDGMRRALEAVKSTGHVRLQEIEKLESIMDRAGHESDPPKVPTITKKSRSKG